MRWAILLVAGTAFGLGLGYLAGSDHDGPSPTPVTVTRTYIPAGTPGRLLPSEVEETRRALIATAERGDYEALRQLIPTAGFEYTFGGPVEGGPVAYWQNLATGGPVTDLLATILKMPYTLSNGIYVWPWAYTVESANELSKHERELLSPLGDPDQFFVPGTGYLGWRAGIAPDGTWVFFVAGD